MILSTVKNLKRVSKKDYLKKLSPGLNFESECVGIAKNICFVERFYDNDGTIVAAKSFFPNRKKVIFLG